MHESQRDTMNRLMAAYFVVGGRVVHDIGSFDVNGSHKSDVLSRRLKYVGVDVLSGPNVDVVVDPRTWAPLPDNSCDYIISGSCLEHVETPWLWAKAMERCLKPGGICIVIMPFSFGEHKYPVDCYRILPDGLRFLFTKWAGLCCLECAFTPGNTDTYFVGRKYPFTVMRGR